MAHCLGIVIWGGTGGNRGGKMTWWSLGETCFKDGWQCKRTQIKGSPEFHTTYVMYFSNSIQREGVVKLWSKRVSEEGQFIANTSSYPKVMCRVGIFRSSSLPSLEHRCPSTPIPRNIWGRSFTSLCIESLKMLHESRVLSWGDEAEG